MFIELEVAKSMHQERLREAERDRLGQAAVGLSQRHSSRKPSVLFQLRRWLAALRQVDATGPRPSMKPPASKKRPAMNLK